MPDSQGTLAGAANTQRVVLLRHGQTEWSVTGEHTGRTDVPLTDVGRDQARAVAPLLPPGPYGTVLTSPLRRAADTATLAGYSSAEREPDLMEWDYGDVEGRSTAELRREDPTWDVWRHGVNGGETVEAIGERVDRVIARVRAAAADGDALLIAHSHVLRILTARWLGLPPDAGRSFVLATTHWSVLGWERETPVVISWNEGAR